MVIRKFYIVKNKNTIILMKGGEGFVRVGTNNNGLFYKFTWHGLVSLTSYKDLALPLTVFLYMFQETMEHKMVGPLPLSAKKI